MILLVRVGVGFCLSRSHVTYIGVEPAGYCVTVAVGRALGIVCPVPGDGHVVRSCVAVLGGGEGRDKQRDEEGRGDHVISPNLEPCLAPCDAKGGETELG